MATPWKHQPSPWPAAAWAAGWWNRLSTGASCLAVNQNRKYEVFLGSFEYLFFSDKLLYIRLVWFQCKVTILFTVFRLAPGPLTRTQRATAATKYSMHILPFLPPRPQEGIWSKTSKQNDHHQQNLWHWTTRSTTEHTLKMYPWCMLSMVIISHGQFPSFVIMSLARVWHQSWSSVRSLCL